MHVTPEHREEPVMSPDRATRRPRVRRSRVCRAVIAVLAAVLLLPAGIAGADGQLEEFVALDPAAGEFPEGIAIGKTGIVYLSLLPRDQILEIDRDGTRSVLAQLPVGSRPAGMALDAAGTLYVAGSGILLEEPPPFKTNREVRGVYRIARDGSFEHIAGSDAIVFPNDVTLDRRGNLYVTDSSDGAVWRIPRRGAPELWLQDELLEGLDLFGFGPIGANGIAFHHDRIIVANTEAGRLVEIPVRPDGTAGVPTTLVEDAALEGTDGIALDVHGTIYAATGLFNTVVRVEGDGSVTTLATVADGLSQPSTMAFGTVRGEQPTLFVANFSIFETDPKPGVVKLPVDAPGRPMP